MSRASRFRVRQHAERALYDRESIYRFLDAGFVCHVGFVLDGVPFVIPTTYVRSGDRLYIHGARGSRMATVLGSGTRACVAVTLVDGLVLARSAVRHSLNYRSVLVFGTFTEVTDEEEKTAALRALLERLVPGRWAEVRPPSAQELRATATLALTMEEASAKTRVGPPIDLPEDERLLCWAGEIPLAVVPQLPVPMAGLDAAIRPPARVRVP